MVEQRAGARGKEVLSWLWIGRTHPSLSVRLAGLPSRKTPSGLCGFYRVWWEGRGWGEANGGAGGGVTECSLVSAANELNQNQLALYCLNNIDLQLGIDRPTRTTPPDLSIRWPLCPLVFETVVAVDILGEVSVRES